MKNIKLNSKKILVIILSGFVIITSSACSNKKETVSNYSSNDNYAVENKIDVETSSKESNSEIISSESSVSENKPNEESKTTNQTEPLTTNDNEVIAYFDELELKVEELLNYKGIQDAKDKLKGIFITIVDFIFYDGEINGIKFDDLTEGAKQNILETASSIDNKIMTKFPNYKEEISSTVSNAYNKASELIKNGANNVKDFSKEKLGEENYNAIKDAKEELVYYTKNAIDIIGNAASTIWNTGKEKVKNWYENFKNN